MLRRVVEKSNHPIVSNEEMFVSFAIFRKELAVRLRLGAKVCASFVLGAFVCASIQIDAANAQTGKVVATHGAWQINCGTPPGSSQEKCAAVQSVTAEDRPDVGLTVIFLKSVDGQKKVLRVVAPLGVLLPFELGLKIDDADIGRVKYQQCGRIGCLAQVDISADLEEKLTKGSQAIFIIFQTQEAGIGIPISLEGLSDALKRLK